MNTVEYNSIALPQNCKQIFLCITKALHPSTKPYIV